MQNSIDLSFGDGLYTFALPVPQIEELQRKTSTGIGRLFARVLKGCTRIGEDVVLAPHAGEFYVLDLVETLRHGLIGGNHGVVNGTEIQVSPTLADRLIVAYVLTRPLADSWSLAASVLIATVVGYEPQDKKKDGSDPKPKRTKTRKAGSTTAESSPTVQ